MAPRIKKSSKDANAEKGSSKKERGGKRGLRRTAGGRRRIDKSKTKGKQKVKLKGWLATPADWARFNAWAKINAQPKKIPEPEAIVRPSKPLSQLKKRIKMLSQPRKAPDSSVNCRFDFTIPRAALKVIPSKRTMLLALPNVRLVDYGRIYYKVSPAALKYEPTERILALSQPRSYLPEECKPPRLSMCEQKREVDQERLKMLALAKKLLHCPEQLTPEEIEQIFTPRGIKRSALIYEITPWMTFLALPPYKKIKERKDENAVTWKRRIIEEGEKRGKSAFAEQRRRRRRKGRREAKNGKKRKKRKKARKDDDASEEIEEEKAEETVTEEDEENKNEEEKDKEEAEKRKIEKHAWRFAPLPYKDAPFTINRAVLKYEASPRIIELSKARSREERVTRADAFTVKKGALSASATGRIDSLAKPKKPRSPVERKPPREKDKYGRPIFEMPVYEKVLPKTKPYKMGECPPEEKKKVAKKRPIDPIAYESTLDPCIYPDMAKKQKMERDRAAKLSPKERGRKRRKRKKKETPETETVEEKVEEEKEREEAEEMEETNPDDATDANQEEEEPPEQS